MCTCACGASRAHAIDGDGCAKLFLREGGGNRRGGGVKQPKVLEEPLHARTAYNKDFLISVHILTYASIMELETIFSCIQTLYVLVETVRGNAERCKEISDRAQRLVPALRRLHSTPAEQAVRAATISKH